MSILIFIAVIVVLIVVHEFGHFVAAKFSGMRVDEFGLGYPPRALTIAKIGETSYTLNWIPFGGFVKIYGEDGLTDHAKPPPRSFASRPRILQAIVLVAGVTMNLVLAYVLIVGALIAGTPRALAPEELARAHDVSLAVATVLPHSPAAEGGIQAGDSILSMLDTKGEWHASDFKSFSEFVNASAGETIAVTVKRGTDVKVISVTPKQGIVEHDASRYALGVEVGTIGRLPVSFGEALIEGAVLTWGATVLTAQGLWHFFSMIFMLRADFSQVAGPVGIAGAVGNASAAGLGDLLSLTAIISINLALINLIPIPALDGGRLLFVLIESITRRRISPKIAQTVNGISYALLILLMVVITIHDITRITG